MTSPNNPWAGAANRLKEQEESAIAEREAKKRPATRSNAPAKPVPAPAAPVDVQGDPTFAMLTCAHGAEGLVKDQIANEGWRLAFSRPGFVTAKHDQAKPIPTGIFIRTGCQSLGSAKGQQGDELIDKLFQAIESLPKPIEQLHVWPRDRAPIGRFDFEPEIDEVAQAVAARILQRADANTFRCSLPNQIAQPGESVLDVVLVDPSQWFFGTHTATTLPTRWPGGVQPVAPEHEPISRAYYKAAESIAWSGFDMRPGDLAIEVGSAPGGACGRLLEMGLNVIGIDPAEMDPRIAEHPRFQHYAARAGDLPRRIYRGAKWLLVDSTVKPDATLSTVRNILESRETSIEGSLITMKLGDYSRAAQIPRWRDEVLRWGPDAVEVRQLARNRCEVCFAVKGLCR
ncbi:23S rRNA (cytidine2498-2'-O)-methyltransferase [Neorhodopirellula lusitana]|uniref:23S rRNA (Cytidine2498-2'-O)-methyltransferase n=2 Tax=Neorhodopirellula lusitana TaxID=445327 RepID=A0ABY1Q8U6_9BACT|nr:SAM-dependent methyltransferase [Neorhodopirellula lusitana]SMP63413.1 23S rRNA (cytidine2498-2'-O)-methyltransferase [Neorhodopirellula lusitana]